MKKKIAIIGAGPAGIFTALQLKNFDGEIFLFDQNDDIGEKLKITGGGRMNVTNKKFSSADFFSHQERLKDNFFKNPITQNPEKILQDLGVIYIWEKNRAILQSQDARKEVARLKERLEKQENLELRLGGKIIKIDSSPSSSSPPSSRKFMVNCQRKELSGTSCTEQKNTQKYDICILATGGMFRMKEKNMAKENIYSLPKFLGHTITKTSPSLSPLRIQNHLLKNCSGISLEAEIFSLHTSASHYQKKITVIKDDLLITHFGFSGPAILDFSAYRKSEENIFINFLPHITPEKFSQALREKNNGKISLKNFCKKFLPTRLAENILEIANISPQKKCAEISKTEENTLKEKIFSYPLKNPQPFPYPGTWTTKGGIDLREIQMHSLESKKIPNLFFAGEVLDIDGLCGGYHISFSAICGEIIAESVLGGKG